MKFIIKLIHVFIGVILFIGLFYYAGEYIEYLEDRRLEESENESNEILKESKEETVEEEKDIQSTDENHEKTDESHEDMQSDHESVDDHSSNDVITSEDNQNQEDDSIQSDQTNESVLSYDMEALKGHSIYHVKSMITYIADYMSSPNRDFEEMATQIIYTNYIHFEEELSEKNYPVFETLDSYLYSIETYNEETSDVVIETNLSLILDILKALESVEE